MSGWIGIKTGYYEQSNLDLWARLSRYGFPQICTQECILVFFWWQPTSHDVTWCHSREWVGMSFTVQGVASCDVSKWYTYTDWWWQHIYTLVWPPSLLPWQAAPSHSQDYEHEWGSQTRGRTQQMWVTFEEAENKRESQNREKGFGSAGIPIGGFGFRQFHPSPFLPSSSGY